MFGETWLTVIARAHEGSKSEAPI